MRKFFKFIFLTVLIFGMLSGLIAAGIAVFLYLELTRDLPKIEKLSDYRPKAVTSMYAADGTLIAEFFDDRRYPAKFNEIPKLVKNAFLAAEDANFYNHPGIDPLSIFRAVYKNLRHKSNVQGASTITQQIVKSLLLTREKTYERKAKEAILSYRLEKALTKDEIYSIYLNEIFLGSGAYGVKAASRTHFHKEMDQLTLGEVAFLAGLPQKPSSLMDPAHRRDAFVRQHYVLEQMERNRMITSEQHKAALAENLTIYPPDPARFYDAPYFVGHAKTVLDEKIAQISPGTTASNPGGFEVYTTVDLRATELAEKALHRGLEEVDKRRGWRGPLKSLPKNDLNRRIKSAEHLAVGEIYPAAVKQIKSGVAVVQVGGVSGVVDLKAAAWAKRFLDKEDRVSSGDPASVVKVGDLIEVSLDIPAAGSEQKPAKAAEALPSGLARFVLNQTPDIEGSFVLANPHTGEVKVILGGYDYQRSVFNRATQGLRQPGSSFKPFIYLAALDSLHYTPSTIVPDSPISLVAGNGELWTPGNFDGKFLGSITLRTALQRSRNVVSVYLLTKLGIDRGIQSARNLGITTPIGHDLSISLGTPEVKLIEMVRAYGVFAAGGYLADQLIISQIKDRDGRVIYSQYPHQKKVISDESAFVMASMMKGVVERGTATVIKQLGRPTAGKTGTTNDQMDAWFIGYTPEWAAGTWVGFDQKKQIGKMETGGKAAAPVFLYFMQDFLGDSPPIDFDPPDGVVPIFVDLESGHPVAPGEPRAFVEYFKSGTEPTGQPSVEHASAKEMPVAQDEYLSSDAF